jgi:hypothetical protein
MTVAIVYNGGSYGTYLEWCLTSLTTSGELISPFTSLGNSHGFTGNLVNKFQDWQEYLISEQQHQFVRLHPKTSKDEDLSNNLNHICNTVDSVVYIYPDPDSLLLCVNNYLTKIWSNWWEFQINHYLDVNLIYQNWPVDPTVNIEQMPRWIQREFLSFYLIPAWFSQIEWNHLDRWLHPNACSVTVKDLLGDFELTLQRIQNHCGIKFVRPISDLIPYHNYNLTLQSGLGQDQLCNNIINATLAKEDLEWNTLLFGSEVWIQWKLRELGFEIECDGLDIFPTNSIQLRELLYPV